MKAFLAVCGSLFALLVIAHLLRIRVEPDVVHNPWFVIVTIVSAGLSAWAWRLAWTTRRS